MKRLDWRAFIFGLTFLSATVFAVPIFYGQTSTQDWYFNDQVLIDGVTLPSDMDANTGKSTVSIEGEGTMMIGHQTKGAGKLNVTVVGGTTITSERRWESGDTKVWWEGIFPVPGEGQDPSSDKVSFATEGKHPDSWIVPLATYSMGLSNETFQFSKPAYFTFATEIPDGTKLWMAFKEKVTPAENADAEWKIAEGDFCVVEDDICQVTLNELNEVSFVEEYFRVCPRSGSSDTQVENGTIGAAPKCSVSCNRGYTLDYANMKCVADEEEEIPQSVETESGSETAEATTIAPEVKSFRPGYLRFAGTRSQLENVIETEGLSGDELARAQRHNASVRKTVADDMPEEVLDTTSADSEKDSFLNYLLQIRNFFGADSNANVVRSEEARNEAESEENADTEETHASAPLLPSTGPGIFLGVAALGLGCMMIGRRRK
ncbi:hypothetical protein K9L63_01495 [Candidatus Gracilibacteria bacterium]|nr:hypothetical protein [Candidatus Gracilibacteria bacterium]